MVYSTRRRKMRGSISTGYHFKMIGNNNGSRIDKVCKSERNQRRFFTDHRRKQRLRRMINAELAEEGFSVI